MPGGTAVAIVLHARRRDFGSTRTAAPLQENHGRRRNWRPAGWCRIDAVAKHYHLPGWHHPSTNQFRYVNLPISNKLKPQTQARIETTCTAAVIMALAEASTKDPVFKKVDESMAASCVAFPAIITGLPGKMYGAG